MAPQLVIFHCCFIGGVGFPGLTKYIRHGGRVPYAVGIVILFFITIIFIVLSLTIGESDEVYSILEHVMLVIGACLNLFPLRVLMSLSGRMQIVVSDEPIADSQIPTAVLDMSRIKIERSTIKKDDDDDP